MLSKNMRILHRTLKSASDGLKCRIARNSSVWTQDKIIQSPYEKIDIPNSTLYDYVWQNLEKWPERTLSVCADTGRGYTYAQVFSLSNAFGANLRTKLKIQDGDAVAVMLPNVPDFPIVAMGILEAGGVITTINPIYTAHEVSRQLLMSDAKAIVTLPAAVNVVKDALKQAKLDIPVIAIKTNGETLPEGIVIFNELTEDQHVDKSCLKHVKRTSRDVCFLPYSSGTTGLPKGVELTNRNLVANCEQMNEDKIRMHRDTTATHQDVTLTVLPLFHIYGAMVTMFHKMANGLKLATVPKFQPELFLQALEKTKANLLFVAPPIVLLMASHPAAKPSTFQHLEFIMNGAASLSKADAERFFDKCSRKINFHQGYGLTETSPVVSISPKGTDDFNSVGPPCSNTEVKIVDAQLNAKGPNEEGELLVRGPQVMQGYRDNPAANQEIFTTDGWLRTGDLAVVNTAGHIIIKDRLKDLIKVKGFQVPPAELEAVIRDHPDVLDVGVIGIPHPSKGEEPKAFIVMKKGAAADPKSIKEFVDEKVASYKRVQNIQFVDSIPKNASGKILRKQLKEMA